MTSQKKVLIIEDEKDLREIIDCELNYHSIQTLVAENGSAALELLKTKPVSLIISDVKMPICDGFQFLQEFRKTSKVPVVLMTGDSELTFESAYAMGANGFLKKPFRVDALVAVVNSFNWAEAPEIEKKLSQMSPEFEIKLTAEDWIAPLSGTAMSLRSSDMFVSCRPPKDIVNKKISFEIHSTKADSTLIGTGMIVWTREELSESGPQGCCVRFLNLTESNQRSLDELLELPATKSKID